MPRYEVITPLSNGRKTPHAPGKVLTMEEDAADDLVTLGALRPVPGGGKEAPASPPPSPPAAPQPPASPVSVAKSPAKKKGAAGKPTQASKAPTTEAQ